MSEDAIRDMKENGIWDSTDKRWTIMRMKSEDCMRIGRQIMGGLRYFKLEMEKRNKTLNVTEFREILKGCKKKEVLITALDGVKSISKKLNQNNIKFVNPLVKVN